MIMFKVLVGFIKASNMFSKIFNIFNTPNLALVKILGKNIYGIWAATMFY